MNKFIKQELNKVKVAQVPPFDEHTTHLTIPKLDGRIYYEFRVGHYYLIELENYIVKPYDGFTLHDNWNNGVVPKSKYYKCECQKIMGHMVKIQGVGYDYINKVDLTDSWGGWIPIKSCQIIKEL